MKKSEAEGFVEGKDARFHFLPEDCECPDLCAEATSILPKSFHKNGDIGLIASRPGFLEFQILCKSERRSEWDPEDFTTIYDILIPWDRFQLELAKYYL